MRGGENSFRLLKLWFAVPVQIGYPIQTARHMRIASIIHPRFT